MDWCRLIHWLFWWKFSELTYRDGERLILVECDCGKRYSRHVIDARPFVYEDTGYVLHPGEPK